MNNNTTSNEIIAFGPPTGSNYERQTKYIGQFCLQYGNYKLRMKDRNNDGLCCQYGQVRMVVLLVTLVLCWYHLVDISFSTILLYELLGIILGHSQWREYNQIR